MFLPTTSRLSSRTAREALAPSESIRDPCIPTVGSLLGTRSPSTVIRGSRLSRLEALGRG